MIDRGRGRLLCRRCGWCCQNQLIGVSTVETRAIIEHLENKTPEEIEKHLVSGLDNGGTLKPHEMTHEKRKERLLSFLDPCEVFVFDGTVLVKTHVIHLLQKSGRCVFHDPVSSECFVYPARPLTCRMFPYEAKEGFFVMVDETDECPGAGFGEPLNIKRHSRLSKMCLELLSRDDALFWRFVQERAFAKEGSARSHRLYEPELTLSFIDPFVELGLIPGGLSKEEKEK